MQWSELQSPEEWRKLIHRQEEAEAIAQSDGERAFRQAVQRDAEGGNMASNPVARMLVKRGLDALEEAISQWVQKQTEGKGPGTGRGHRYPAPLKWLREKIDTPTAAYITLKVVLDGICKKQKYQVTCSRISDLIVDELRYRRLKEKAPALFEYKMRNFHTSSYAHMARSLDHTVRTAVDEEGENIDVSDLKLTPHLRVQIGAKLVELLVEATGLVIVHYERPLHARHRVQRMTAYLEATPETHAWLTSRTEALATNIMQAYTRPMLLPPSPWRAGHRGGYRFAQRKKYPLIRGQRDKEWGKQVEEKHLPLVYNTLNALQNTGWRINKDVLALLAKIHDAGGGYASIPSRDPLPLPPKPHDISTNEDSKKKWRKLAHEAHNANATRRIRWREVTRVIQQAEKLKEEDAFFYPYSVDFRGRIYPLSDYLHPQGDDLSRALLLFSDAKPLGEDGRRWLAIHGANCLGEVPEGKFSKMTFDERVSWIEQRSPALLQVANDPLGDLWWTTTDSPLQFYAFCVEWRNAHEDPEYRCGLPVMMDGSCNGLQHFSALLRDEVGGKAVNVAPNPRPQDVYEHVAERVKDRLETESDPLALQALALGIVTRKLCKRPTMTFGYGSKRFGFENQINEYLRGLDNWSEIKNTVGQQQVRPLCRLLARLVWESLGDVVVKAQEGMKWFQQCAQGIVKEKRPVEWVVPVTGFPVRQDYMQMKVAWVDTVLAGKMIRLRPQTPTDQVNPTKQRNAVAPNVIHSLDAAVLMLTVSRALESGVEAFAMVHDSYGTLPTDCAVLMDACRQAFYEFYARHNVLESLHQQFNGPPPPKYGTLEISGVLASDYFFA